MRRLTQNDDDDNGKPGSGMSKRQREDCTAIWDDDDTESPRKQIRPWRRPEPPPMGCIVPESSKRRLVFDRDRDASEEEIGEPDGGFGMIPDNALLMILQYFIPVEWPHMLMVCRRWRRVGRALNPFQSAKYVLHAIFNSLVCQDKLLQIVRDPRIPVSSLSGYPLEAVCSLVRSEDALRKCLTHANARPMPEHMTTAVKFGNSTAVGILLEDCGMDISQLDLKAACRMYEGGEHDVLETILGTGRCRPFLSSSIWFRVWCTGHQEAVLLRLIQEEACRTPVNMVMAMNTAMKGRSETLLMAVLLAEVVNPSRENQMVLRKACKEGWEQVTGLLLDDERVDPSIVDQTPLRLAVINGHIGVVRKLLRHHMVDPSISSNAPLMDAIETGDEDMALVVLQYLDPTIHTEWGKSPLIAAIQMRMSDLVGALLSHPDVDVNEFNHTPLRMAMSTRNCEILGMLLRHPNINITKGELYTCFAICSAEGQDTASYVLHSSKFRNHYVMEHGGGGGSAAVDASSDESWFT